ncbi:outer membrane protein assembly factor BamE [Neisseria elongata]|jgi:hypothetical protein|nr:outer membrane protein assembly factor BamE [Neisseria elongata]
MESLLWHTVQHYPPHSEKVSSVNRLPILLAAAVIGLSACSAERISNFPSYKLKVIQGNQLDARAVSSLQQGMSRDQVQLLLGTPLLRDPFHSDRWDYTYEISRNGVVNQAETRNLTVWFENDRLVKAEGNALEYARQQQSAATE